MNLRPRKTFLPFPDFAPESQERCELAHTLMLVTSPLALLGALRAGLNQMMREDGNSSSLFWFWLRLLGRSLL
jgi:hypothetical protein